MTTEEQGVSRFGLALPNFVPRGAAVNPGTITKFAMKAEEAGIDSLWCIEQLLAFEPSYKVEYLDPIVTLSAAASITSMVKLGFCVLILPHRHPVVLAKTIASLDVLSRGRIMVGVGIGSSKDEDAALHVPGSERGRRVVESIKLMKKLWQEDHVSFDGHFFQVKNLTMYPKPIQKPHPPLLYGGGTLDPELYNYPLPGEADHERILDRIARLCDGVITMYRSFPVTSAERAERDWARISEYALAYGKNPSNMFRIHLVHTYIGNDSEIKNAVESFTPMPLEYVRRMYLLGEPEEILRTLRSWHSTSGIRYFVLNFIANQLDQLNIFQSLLEKARNVSRLPTQSE